MLYACIVMRILTNGHVWLQLHAITALPFYGPEQKARTGDIAMGSLA